MGLFCRKRERQEKTVTPVLVAVIENTTESEIFQDILRENNIPFICRQEGAGAYLKVLAGGLLVADSIYVEESNLQRAKELYEAYLKTEIEHLEEEV